MLTTQILTKIHNLINDYENSQSLASKLPDKIPNINNIGSQNWQDIIDSVEYYLTHSINTSHPNFANRMWSGANTPSIIGEIITAITNTSACTQESAPVAMQMEKYMFGEMLKLVDFKGGEGQMTTGSSNSNMLAMMVARNKFIENCKNNGLFGAQKLVAFVNTDAHYSFDKAANILGIGADNLIKIKNNNLGEMDIIDLEKQIIHQQKLGNIAFFVSATLGTTVRGAYDNIDEIFKLKQKYNFFLHGDGAWGGSVIMSDKLKQKFIPNTNKLDSFTMDFHKMLGANLICNVLLFNHNNENLTKTCALGDVSYIFREDNDLGVKSLQCGRRVDSLKWFLDWQFYGKEGFAKRIENYYSLVNYAQNLATQNQELEIINPQYSFNLCFRFKGENQITQGVRDKLLADNQALLSLAYIEDKLVFRLLIANVNTTKATLDNLFILLSQTQKNLVCK